ncbi:MAG: 5-formyltetrahydrofolate cyclo-ligase [Alphaproteobacteria bacterium]|nr:5-formyltetrahydrofolate cyclo-ligase [Alphaproteobacteria bacterium]
MTASLPEDKAALRKAAAAARQVAHDAAHTTAPLRLAAHKLPAMTTPGFNAVSAFFPYRSEMDTRPLLGRLAGEGWKTCLPVVIAAGQPLVFRRWLPGEPTFKGVMNIDCPAEDAEVLEPDMLIVPLLAFDRQGYRLGYGGGFYDRTLAKLRAKKKIIAIGAAYAAQEVSSVPHGPHDQPLDYIITENELMKCG